MAQATITIQGNVGRDPEERTTKSGKTMVTFSVAVTDRVKENDQWVDGTTTWYRVTVFDWQADNVMAQVKKGQAVVVGGRFSIDEWEGNDGALRTTPTIFADYVGIKPRAERQQQAAPRQQARPQARRQEEPVEVPF